MVVVVVVVVVVAAVLADDAMGTDAAAALAEVTPEVTAPKDAGFVTESTTAVEAALSLASFMGVVVVPIVVAVVPTAAPVDAAAATTSEAAAADTAAFSLEMATEAEVGLVLAADAAAGGRDAPATTEVEEVVEEVVEW